MTPDKIIHRIEGKMEEIKSYHITGEVEIITPHTTRVYYLEQWFEEPDNYRLEMKGENTSQVLISTEGETWIYHPELEDYYRLSNHNDYNEEEGGPPFLLTDIWNNIVTAGEIEILEEKKIQGETTCVLKVTPRDRDPLWYREIIWLDKKKLTPRVVEVYDDQDNLRRILRYRDVSINKDIEPEVFSTNFPLKESLPECQVVQLSLEEAEEEFPYPILIPSFIPRGTGLSLVTLIKEITAPFFKSVILNYQGDEQFSVIQEVIKDSGKDNNGEEKEVAGAPREAHRGSKKIPLKNSYGYFREDNGVNTLYWMSPDIRYTITGDLEMKKMIEVALSMKAMKD